MKVLITGANGFIGKNLVETLKKLPHLEILTFTKTDTLKELDLLLENADFIFHLAGVNRPNNASEFYTVNTDLTKTIVNTLEKINKKIPILLSSSSQIGNGTDYAKSKEESEKIIQIYSIKNDVNCYIYRLPNIFGKWAKPNYNSVIATWCHNITRDLPIEVNDQNTQLSLVYIGDVIHAFIDHVLKNDHNALFYEIKNVYQKTLTEITSLLYAFKTSRETLLIPNVGLGFERALYATYVSYLPEDKFSYCITGHQDSRGSFYEVLKTLTSGQISISTTKPGVTRGNHYHNTKNEKFLVVKGKALIELRNIYSDNVVKYYVSDEKMEIVEMIVGYTHNITNIGDIEMILLIWANECYNPDTPDTNFLKV